MTAPPDRPEEERRRSPRAPDPRATGSIAAAAVPAPWAWSDVVQRRPFLTEVFAVFNFAFLSLDIFVAHSVNAFRNPAEWIPFAFTLLAAVSLLVNLATSAPLRRGAGRPGFEEGGGHRVGVVVGGLAVVVGVAGLLWHLESQFFEAFTLRSLVYSAPFVAPLAFTGLGLLVLLNRLVPTDTVEWGQWILLLAWGGFIGNFVLSLADHAQNGFFYPTEWIPVVVAAFVVGSLIVPIFRPAPARYLRLAMGVLFFAALTGVAGFIFHVSPVLDRTTGTLAERVIYGAPIFAPLLFPNLAILGLLGLWDLQAKGFVAGTAAPADPATDAEATA